MRFEFHEQRWYFRLGLLIVLMFAFPDFLLDDAGKLILILVAYFLGAQLYKLYKRFFFSKAVVFDFHGVMAKGDLSLDDFTDMPGMRELVRALRKNYKVALLTNLNPELFKFYAPRFGFETLFDFVFYSGKIREVKGPKPDIFNYVMRRLGVSPKNMIFIDDKADYLVGAKAAGIITIHFQSPEQVMAELRKMGVRF
ncbi:MAG TPA: HAD-IA family hydrolase [Candidatus Norongarragalinales archaeon]|nr:HAD-IA family hydrolase [Candidatus Norongarragalinales archaeon]